MSSSTAALMGPRPGRGSFAKRLRGSLKDSTVARLLVNGSLAAGPVNAAVVPLTVSAAAAAAEDGARVPLLPSPIDLSMTVTREGRARRQPAVNGCAPFSLTTIATIERLRYILSYETQRLLSRMAIASLSPSQSSVVRDPEETRRGPFACRLCPCVASQFIELLGHYRSHGDALVHLGQTSPQILTEWFEHYLETSTLGSVASNGVGARIGVGAGARERWGQLKGPTEVCERMTQSKRFDLRDLLTKPARPRRVNSMTLSSLTSTTLTLGRRHRALSESHPGVMTTRVPVADEWSRSRSSSRSRSRSKSNTPFTVVSAHTDEDNDTDNREAFEADNRGTGNACRPLTYGDAYVTSGARRPESGHSEKTGSGKSSPDGVAASHPEVEELAVVSELLVGPIRNDGTTEEDKKEEEEEEEKEEEKEGERRKGDLNGGVHGSVDRWKSRLPDGSSSSFQSGSHLSSCSTSSHLFLPLSSSALRFPSEISNCDERSRSRREDDVSPDDVIRDAAPGRQRRSRSTDDDEDDSRETVQLRYAYKQYKRLRRDSVPTRSPPLESKGLDDLGTGSRSSLQGHHLQAAGNHVGIQCDLTGCGLSRITGHVTKPEQEEEEEEKKTGELTAPGAVCPFGRRRPHRCNPCGMTFDDDVIYAIHVGCHSHANPFVCNVCGRRSENKYAFNTHMIRGHHPT